MRQSFRRLVFRLSLDPRTPLYAITFLLYLGGLLFYHLILLILALIFVLWTECWVKRNSRTIGENFRLLPAILGHSVICQHQRKKGNSCHDLRKSLIDDSKIFSDDLPEGTYQTITHDGVIRRLRREEGITIIGERYAYSGDLHQILRVETGDKCKRCSSKCYAWNAPPRPFYLVTFSFQPM